MPELPEVQTVVDDLSRKIVGRKILKVWSDWPKVIRSPEFPKFKRAIRGLKINRILRRAKNILIYLEEPKAKKEYLLLIHQKMTGHLLVGKWQLLRAGRIEKIKTLAKGRLREKINSYIHLIFYLDKAKMLGLSDVRKFAKVVFGPAREIEQSEHLSKLGPEPLDSRLTLKIFSGIIGSERRKIKQVLMDQRIIAGIGNIYSDEILWLSKISPLRPADSLHRNELNNLYKATRLILKKALELRGTSISNFRDTAGQPGFYGKTRLVYGREREPCPRCSTPIKRVKIGSRSAHFCPRCQR